MGKIIISENVSLDGVVQDPTGEEGFSRGGWFLGVGDADREEWARIELDEALAAEALLLGRRSDEWFAARWQSRTGARAERLNSMPKYVVSSTLGEARWGNSTVLSGDAVTEVAALKQRLAGEIVVYASARLVHTLLEHDLADELRLTVYPVLLGTGQRLFGETSGGKPMRLVGSRAIGDSLTYLSYEVIRNAASGPEGGTVQASG
jgi:dihydrofolate reductase